MRGSSGLRRLRGLSRNSRGCGGFSCCLFNIFCHNSAIGSAPFNTVERDP
ncbi:hypothetical protein CY0110_16802 [Crocosphaera chwakensis CCY0110]|uniref:Uncharacterized protein n=1 Tax=Crocosphaera chwakensis CCY0110 TaxID=391612 RepID=A3II42_9CHRO|nr:hypothetical protein CY0110_16802 [Crocosphaera chwakensis CCY0110]